MLKIGYYSESGLEWTTGYVSWLKSGFGLSIVWGSQLMCDLGYGFYSEFVLHSRFWTVMSIGYSRQCELESKIVPMPLWEFAKPYEIQSVTMIY